jgi:transposase
MNLLLHNVVNDITGATGMAIIRAILDGQRDPEALARLRHPTCKNSVQVMAQSLVGTYRDEHLFELQQAVDLYDAYQAKIAECDRRIERYLAAIDHVTDDAPPTPAKRLQPPVSNQPRFDARTLLYQLTGVDLTRIDGIAAHTALTLVSEIGADMTRWPSVKHFASWLGLCPGTKVSGGKVLSSKSKRSANHAAQALRLAANSLYRSRSALGAYLRRQSARLGKSKAITATAHKLARLVYNLLKHGTEYADAGADYYERVYKERVIKNLARRARELGYELVTSNATPQV